MAEGDQLVWNVFTYAAAPVACGHAMDVPDNIVYFMDLVSPGIPEGLATGENAANISTPGALISGLTMWGTIVLGPRDENETTTGASKSFIVSLGKMVVGRAEIRLHDFPIPNIYQRSW